MRTDLHLHTDRSDGWDRPQDLLAELRRRRIRWWSICDHDTVTAYDDLRASGSDLTGLIPGVELSSSHAGQEVHILALGIDVDAPGLRGLLTEQQRLRRCRATAIIEHLRRSCDWHVALDQVIPARSDSPSRSHIAWALLRDRVVPHLTAAFADLLSSASLKALGLEPFVSVSDAVAILHDLGAVCFLAHPCTLSTMDDISAVLDAGLDGLELRCPSAQAAQEQSLIRAVQDRDLLISAGSDHHGFFSGQSAKPCHIGDWRLTGREINRLLSALSTDLTMDGGEVG